MIRQTIVLLFIGDYDRPRGGAGKRFILATPYMVTDVAVPLKGSRPLSDSDYATEDSGSRQLKGQQDSASMLSPPPSPFPRGSSLGVKQPRPRLNALSSLTFPLRSAPKPKSRTLNTKAAVVKEDKPKVKRRKTGLSSADGPGHYRTPLPASSQHLSIGPRYFGEPISPVRTPAQPTARARLMSRDKRAKLDPLPSNVPSEDDYLVMVRPVPAKRSSIHAEQQERDGEEEEEEEKKEDSDGDDYVTIKSSLRPVTPTFNPVLFPGTAATAPQISHHLNDYKTADDFKELQEAQKALQCTD